MQSVWRMSFNNPVWEVFLFDDRLEKAVMNKLSQSTKRKGRITEKSRYTEQLNFGSSRIQNEKDDHLIKVLTPQKLFLPKIKTHLQNVFELIDNLIVSSQCSHHSNWICTLPKSLD